MTAQPSLLVSAWRQALLAGAILLAAPSFAAGEAPARKQAAKSTATASQNKAARPKATVAAARPAAKPAAATKTAKAAPRPAPKPAPEPQGPGPLADFGQVEAPPPVVHLANWVSYTRNNGKKAFVLIDKKLARMYVFDPKGKLKSNTTVLLGKAIGDHTVPGVGNKPLSQIQEHEKTTPAGRFVAAPGRNTSGEDIIWIDYDASVSLHRLRKVGKEQRAERLASPDLADNRISNGCVNVPHKFYNTVLKPTVTKQGAYVYVLPETRTPQQLFGSFDVPADAAARVQVAAQDKARK